MRLVRTAPALTLAAVACIALPAGCGNSQSKGLLSASQANSINGALDRVDSAVAAGDCAETAAASDSLRQIVANLPASVDTALRGSLLDGTAKVSNLGAADCAKATTDTTTSSSSSSTTSPTTSPTTSSSITSTTTSSTTTSTTTTTPPTTTTTTSGGGATPDG